MIELLLMMGSTSPATWNPSDAVGVVLSERNSKASSQYIKGAVLGGATDNAVRKRYCEITVNVSSQMFIGIASRSWTYSEFMGVDAAKQSCGYYSGGLIYAQAGLLANPTSPYGAGDVISVAVDRAARRVYYAFNGAWIQASNPVAGTGGTEYVTNDPVYPAFQAGDNGVNTVTANFEGPFLYTPPEGYGIWV